MLTTSWLYTKYFKTIVLPTIALKRYFRIRRIRKDRKAKVVFVVSSLSMWKSLDLFYLLSKDEHFEPLLVLCPYAEYDEAQKLESLKELVSFCTKHNISYINIYEVTNPGLYFRNEIAPDIIFYPQQYLSLYRNGIDSEFYDDRLLSFIPYGFNTFEQGWAFRQRFNNIAWRLYYSTKADLKCAKKFSLNKGKNVRIVGNPSAGAFIKTHYPNPWKRIQRKRIIWSPHYSIKEGGFTHRSSFLDLHHFMLELAIRYVEQIQIAFKPHPRLLTELYNHPDWGKEKADAYYRQWAEMPNTQLETGEYIDLFMNSDAMIHDCGSFTAEYLYTQRPVMFYTHDRKAVEKQLNELGMAALDAHYIGESADDIESFIKDVVIGENDPKVSARKAVYDKYLLPPYGRSTAENIYHDLLSSLGFEK